MSFHAAPPVVIMPLSQALNLGNQSARGLYVYRHDTTRLQPALVKSVQARFAAH
jgi:hypothetical protein